MPEVRVKNVTKKFDETVAVDNVSFTARDGELLSLLGPSGCGKTTTLSTSFIVVSRSYGHPPQLLSE